ncbi:MAG: helicase, partial [Treponema sp.]|nr:helicase [Treponema sp.]
IFTDLENVALDILDSSSTFRLMPKTERVSGPLVSLSASLEKELNLFLKELKYLFRNLNDDDSASSAYWEARLALKRLEAIADTALSFSEWKDNADYVFWIQKKNLIQDGKDESFVVFNKTPLDISALMNTGVFEPLQTVVCTSATLKINNSFAWWACRCGAEFAGEERLLFKDFPSSFPYKKNVLLAVPKDAPFPESVFEFQSFISKAIINLVNIAEGRTLVLFTSYEMLNATYADIKKNLSSYKILRQGSEDSSALLKEFKSLENSVLLATDSFWQGVDVPGNSLVQVVIVKLPFPVPSEPVFAARCDSISERGGSSFMELSVPEAVIKFRQGFGRLMRRSSDFGVVVVLDRRIYEKRYGKYFLNSIPETKQVYENLSELENTISSFLWD